MECEEVKRMEWWDMRNFTFYCNCISFRSGEPEIKIILAEGCFIHNRKSSLANKLVNHKESVTKICQPFMV